MTISDEMRRAVPEALYSCRTEHCATDVSYPAEMLTWWRDGFYCETCIDELAPHQDDILGDTEDERDEQWDRLWEERHDGPSLATVLASVEDAT